MTETTQPSVEPDAEQLFPVKDLPKRYGIAQQTMFNRRHHLGIQGIKQGTTVYITPAQLEQLDQLDDYLKRHPNAKMSDFPITSTSSTGSTGIAVTDDNVPLHNDSDLLSLIEAVAQSMQPKTSPLNHWEQLEKAVQHNWLLTTKEVHELAGAKPKGQQWTRGAFQFIRQGKIGSQTAWQVNKKEEVENG